MIRQQGKNLAALLLLVALLLSTGCAVRNSAFTLPSEAEVSIFPPDAIAQNASYRDWFGPTLNELNERPLWIDERATPGAETLRFTFIPGLARISGRKATVIRVDLEGSSARLIARSKFYGRREGAIRELENRSLSATEIATLRDLSDKADAWKFPVGTWEDAEPIAIHCTELIMERRQPSSYGVSHILISCKSPNRLMPLINYVAELARQSRQELRY